MKPGPGVTRTSLPKGFSASGIHSGIRRYRPDLGVIISEIPAVTAGLFTLNECKSASVLYSQKLLPSDNILAIVTNSGQANAGTGAQGIDSNLRMAHAISQRIGCKVHQVLTASTGAIGVPLEIEKIEQATSELISRQSCTAEPFALAILTTDLVPKSATTEVHLEHGKVRITGIAKGSGMIHPNMATMLGYFLTDAAISQSNTQTFLKKTTDKSFNLISVDGESSTNDCVFLMANGASGVPLCSEKDSTKFQEALDHVAIFLAKSIARDGEGATKLIEVNLRGSPTEALAKKAARGVVMSPLVKTAIHGESPNWGRILARLGSDSVPASALSKMELKIQNIPIFKSWELESSWATELAENLKKMSQELKSDTVIIDIDLKSGPFSATAWGCDLSKKYIEINSDYLT